MERSLSIASVSISTVVNLVNEEVYQTKRALFSNENGIYFLVIEQGNEFDQMHFGRFNRAIILIYLGNFSMKKLS